MTDNLLYFNYLNKRSIFGHLYRNFFLYPRLSRFVYGNALDIGCGIGDFLKYRPATIGVDINPLTVNSCLSRGLNAKLMQFDVLPFPNHTFDTVLLDNVLEHLESPLPLLFEIHRALRLHGRLIVGVPGLKGYASDLDHKVFYDESMLVSTLLTAGFTLSHSFHMPFMSDFLNRRMRQYCVYGLFTKILT